MQSRKSSESGSANPEYLHLVRDFYTFAVNHAAIERPPGEADYLLAGIAAITVCDQLGIDIEKLVADLWRTEHPTAVALSVRISREGAVTAQRRSRFHRKFANVRNGDRPRRSEPV